MLFILIVNNKVTSELVATLENNIRKYTVLYSSSAK